MTDIRDPLRTNALQASVPRRWRSTHLIYAIPLITTVLLAYMFLTHNETAHKPSRTVPVTVDVVRTQDVPILLRSVGSVTAINSVAVKPHVNGQIMQTHFREGQIVKAGQLLFTIDPRPLQAAVMQQQADMQSKAALVAQAEAAITKDQASLEQAKATIEKDKAVSANAGVEASRYAELAKVGAVSQEQAEQYRTNYVSAQATVKADIANANNVRAMIKADRANLLSAKAQHASAQAMLKNAEVQLSYASVTSPIAGLAGNLQILTGNVVRQDTDVLVTINQIQPINVNLTVPERQFDDVRRFAAAGPVLADVFDSNGHDIASGGRLIFQNNTVDPQTGTVLLKVSFDNSAGKLWPGQFVNTVLTLSKIPHAVVVPSHAVQTGPNGTFLWLLNREKMTAFMQSITTGETAGGVTVITSGVQPGQEVITDGQLQLTPDAKVSISKMRGL